MSLRILLLMDPLIRVPPLHYGGIERVVDDLARGLSARGHEVTLWACPGSETAAALEPFGREGEWTRWSNLRNTARVTARFWTHPRRFDVVHNFGRLAYLLGILRRDVAKVQTYMRRIDTANIRWTERLGSRKLHYTTVSAAIRDTGIGGGGRWSVIYNCATPERYEPRTDTDPAAAPLLFLGRLERCKGAHTAIDVAELLDRRLVIAGNVSTLPEEKEYFERELAPRIDGRRVTYVGPVADEAKARLLAGSAALLMPIEWLEPFPVVLPEALLSATPVIAFRRGGMPEGITDGLTGFLCDTAEEMAAAVRRLPEIDRAACYREGMRRFSRDAIVDGYERLYERLRAGEG